MKISSITDQGTGVINEDVLLIKKPLFGVFDGATSLNRYSNSEGMTGGLLAAEIARDSFITSSTSLIRAAKNANSHIKKAMLKAQVDISKGSSLWRAATAVIKINKDNFEWLVIADCAILLINADGLVQEIVPFQDHDQEVLSKWKQLADKKTLNIREKLSSELFKLRDESHPSYGVLSGDPAMNSLFKTGIFPLNGIKHVLLFTDGLLIPNEDPTMPNDFQEIANLYLAGGLENIKETVRNLENQDPNCWQFPRYKQHDDIAAISISF